MIDTGVDAAATGQDGKFDCAGFYGNTCGSFLSGAPNPKYRHKLRLGLTMPNGLGHLGPVALLLVGQERRARASDCDISATGDLHRQRRAGQREDHGAELLRPGADGPARRTSYNFRLGANNILDKEPPIVGGEVSNAPFGNGNTFPQVYDALGRYPVRRRDDGLLRKETKTRSPVRRATQPSNRR